jgi:hypothetical protein
MVQIKKLLTVNKHNYKQSTGQTFLVACSAEVSS